MIKKVYLIYYNYLNEDRSTVSIGGIQTYLQNLCQVIISLGFEPVMVQLSKENFEVTYRGYSVIGISTTRDKFPREAISHVPQGSVVIFGTHELIVPFKGTTVGIQHGITWDTPVHNELPKKLNNLYIFQRARMAYRLLRQLSYVNTLVCVDNNFINWYRTQVGYPAISMISIPNFSEVPTLEEKPKECINLIFARRLFWYRGTRVFVTAAKRLLQEYGPYLHVTIAGSVEDEKYMRDALGVFSNVNFIKYRADESLSIHKDKHIAVVPTIGSEGTSLSLLEAMSSGCAVVCSDVGGMTNIILNGYNGKMIGAGDADQLYLAIKELIDNPEERYRMAKIGYESVRCAFSYERWVSQWSNVIQNITNN